MFSTMYALADTFISKTGAAVNTAVELACLVVPVNNKFALHWNNLRLFVQRATSPSDINFQVYFEKSVVHNM
jgi:hypothetical protein